MYTSGHSTLGAATDGGFWQSLTSPESQTIATWVGAIAAFWVVQHEFKKWREAKRLSRSLIHIGRARDFDPSLVVGAFNSKGTNAYLPISRDAEINEALRSGCDVLIGGRGGIGKSHAAVHHLQAFRNWLVLSPSKQAVQNLGTIRLMRRRYILFLDELNEYVEACNEGECILDLVAHLRSQAKQVIVVATIRSVTPEIDSILSQSKLLARWKYFELPDWTEQEGKKLAQLAHVDMQTWEQTWDGTPLSVKQPSPEMKLKYDGASRKEQNLLQALKLARTHGIKPIAVQLLSQLCLRRFNMSLDTFRTAMTAVAKKGFLKQRHDSIEAYDPYLDVIEIVGGRSADYAVLRDLLIEQKMVDELMLVGARFYAEKNLDEAETVYRRCIDLKAAQANCHYRLGVVLSRKSNWAEAASQFSEATHLKPTEFRII